MKGEGAVVFLIVFAVLVAITLSNTEIPPGNTLYGYLGVPEVSELVLGIPATQLIVAIFNGVVYGVIIWLIFTILRRQTKEKKEVTVKLEKPT